EAGEAIGAHERPLAGNGTRVTERRKIELDVRTVTIRTATGEATGLIDTERQWTLARQKILETGTQSTPPWSQDIIQCRARAFVDIIEAKMILQVLADHGCVLDSRY